MASRRNTSVMSSRKSMVSTRRSSIMGRVNSSRFGLSQSRRDAKIDKHPDVITKHNIRVFHDGQDVTPKSLLSSSVKESRMEMEKSESRSKINANFNFNDSRAFGPPPELCQSTYGGASTFVASCATGLNQSIMGSMVQSSRASLDSVTSDLSSESNTGISGAPCVADVNLNPLDEREIFTSSDLEKIAFVTLMETETIPLFEMDAISVSNLDEEAEAVIKRNEEYDKLCSIREGNDKYMSRGMQTFNDAFKTKEMQTNTVEVKDVGSTVTNYDLFDTYNDEEVSENEDDIDEDIGAMMTASRKKSKVVLSEDGKKVSQSYAAAASIDEVSQAESVLITPQGSASPLPKVRSKFIESEDAQMERLSKLDSMKENLFIMERTVVQNIYHSKQSLYRGLKDLQFSDEPKGDAMMNIFGAMRAEPNLSRLWAYECASTKGLSATCITWNKTNEDILAVGYGAQETSTSGKGLVCIWSIKNPEYPERLYTMGHAVTSIDFSESRPNLLAVGLFNGAISLYSIRSSADRSVLDSADNPGRHTGPVWQLKWVTRDKGTGEEKGEVLVSAGGDGRVIQWMIIKGFESCDLMKVKRTSKNNKVSQKKGGPAKKSDAFILRFSPAMCFDFNSSDNNIYLVGSEDMNVHRCSYSYNEQFLESYTGHHGPVYKVRWSPFLSDIFLTCSADWSVRLWHVSKTEPILVFQSATKAVIDIDWSPYSSTVFACISENQIEVWDLALSILDPIVDVPVSKVVLTSAVFALNAKVLLVGDCEGFVTVYQLSEMNLDTHHRKKERLWDIVKSSLPKSINSFQDV